MADVRAFRGFRYDLGKVGSLSDVVAPPYDVIDPALRHRLAGNSPFNAVRVELPEAEPGDAPDGKYARAAQALRDWVAADVLHQDTARSLYVYEQEFEAAGRTHTRRGFLARVRLEPFGTGKVFPHEQTLAGPKADRLSLYRATGFNISPVFGLYPDADGEVFGKLEPLVRRAPPVVAVDHLGVVNRLWAVSDSAAVSAVVGAMGPKPVFIADGHHRYETGLKYLAERRAAGDVPDPEAPANFTLMMLVGMSDPGLVVLPTHRLVGGLPPVTADQLKAALAGHFDVVGEFGPDAGGCWEHVQLEDSQAVLGFGTAADNRWVVARLRDLGVMAELAPDRSADWRGLAVSILHRLVLEKLVPEAVGGRPECKYVHLLKEVTDAVATKECQVAALVPPVSMEHVEGIAGGGEVMPPKSTYFYPKLLTGLVFHSLRKD